MKNKKIIVATLGLILIAVISCKTVGRIAAKYWLNREIKEFVSNCEDKASRIVGRDNAHKYCDCAVDLVAEKFHEYQDAKNISLVDLLDFINKCK